MVNAVREIEQPASMIGFMTSNQSLYNKLEVYKSSPDGEMARLIEFVIKRPKQLDGVKGAETGRDIFNTFRNHYGHAVYRYIPYLYKQGDKYVRHMIDKWIARFSRDFKSDSTYRFYENIIGTAFAGAEMAVEAGIVQIDLERVYAKVLSEVLDSRDGTTKINEVDYEGVIGEFMNRFKANTLVINDGRVFAEPNQSLIARVDLTTGMYYVSKTEFKKYLALLQISSRDFETEAKNRAMLNFNGKQRLSTGSGWQSNPINVYGFRLSIPDGVFGG
jgi:hypothetical protein